MNGLSKNSEHLIHLISCALRGAEAEESILNGVNFEDLFVLAQNHTVSAMVCMVLGKTEVFAQADPTVQKQWSDARNKAVRKNMLLDAECKILMDEMENERIWHMQLKGSILKDWYPKIRLFIDIHILCLFFGYGGGSKKPATRNKIRKELAILKSSK